MSAATPQSPDFHAEWVAELDRLEVDVELAEALLAADRAAAGHRRPVERRRPCAGRCPPTSSPAPGSCSSGSSPSRYRLTERLTADRPAPSAAPSGSGTPPHPDVPIYVDLSA